MSTVLRFDGYRVFFYSNDHRPAHVHVTKAGCEAVFLLNCPDGPVELRENYGFKQSDLSLIQDKLNLKSNLAEACKKWRQVHGDD